MEVAAEVFQNELVDLDIEYDSIPPRHIEIFLEAARSPEGMSVRWHLKYQKRIKNASKFKI